MLDGQFSPEEPSDVVCPRCGVQNVTLGRWRAHDNSFEDLRYWCRACDNIWVVKRGS